MLGISYRSGVLVIICRSGSMYHLAVGAQGKLLLNIVHSAKNSTYLLATQAGGTACTQYI